MIHALSAAALLFQAAPQSLPPGHPPIPQGAMNAPPLTEAQQGSGVLPPGHPSFGAAAQGTPPSSQQLLQQLDAMKGLKDQDKPFDVASAVGKLYYGNGRFSDSVVFFRQALAKGEPIRTLYTSELAKTHGQPLPSPETIGCAGASGGDVKPLVQKAEALAREGKALAAASCAKVALRPVLEIQMLLGNALFLTGDTDGALAQHAEVLKLSPDDEESLYSHAGEAFDGANDDLARLKVAKAELTRYLQKYPSFPHAVQAKALLARTDEAIAAGGMSKLPHKRLTGELPVASAGPMMGGGARGPMMAQGGAPNAPFARGSDGAPPPLSQETIDAIQNTQRTPEMMKGLEKLMDEGETALAQGKFQDALDDYKRVVPFMPESGRAKAGMAWALVGMNRQPMADRVWQVAVGADPAAVDQLGDALKAKGDASGAKALWAKLAQTAPDYAAQAKLQGKL